MAKKKPQSATERRIAQLEAENRRLRQRLAEADYLRSMFVASSRRRTFHRPDCKWARYIDTSPNLIEFGSHQEAVENGYKPCKTCRA